MAARVSIGEFSTMTRLTRKALRHYHDLGLLEPAEIDPINGYRYYDTDQLELARLIRRFRDLEMPVPELKAYVAAPDEATRTAIVTAHLDRLQAQLEQTQVAVGALRDLLSAGPSQPRIDVRVVDAMPAIAISEVVALDDVVEWWRRAVRELYAEGRAVSGPPGGLFEHALFSDERGLATVWVPVSDAQDGAGRVRSVEIPGGAFAVATHDGPDARIDETYAALGRFVADRGIGRDGPVRERYLAGVLNDPGALVTEIAWPVQASG